MKTVIINISGNTGKTTLTKHMFAPLLKAKRISIEDSNAGDGTPDLEISSAKFKKLAGELNTADESESFVIDIGGSNAKNMISTFDELASTTELIDCWVIPVTPSTKQITDSLRTAQSLKDLGIEPEKIVLLPNNVTDPESFESDFALIYKARQFGFFVPEQAILSTEAFEILKNDERSIFDVINNKINFTAKKAELRKAGDDEGLAKLGQEIVLYDLSRFASRNIKKVFESIPLFEGQENG